MAQTLSPAPKLAFLDNNGKPAVGYKLFTYQAGSSTKLATYVDSAGGTPNSNPIILDYRGECNVWIPPNVAYKYVFAKPTDTDPPGSPIWSVDNLVNSELTTLYGGVDTGSANAYALNFDANFSSYTDGTIIYWIPSNSNTGASTINVNSLGPVAITQQDGSALVAGQIQENEITQIVYIGTGFVLSAPVSGSFTVTLTGVSGTVQGTAKFVKNGRFVTVIFPTIVGTSDSTAKSLTGIPASLAPSVNAQVTVNVLDSASANRVGAYAQILLGASVVEIRLWVDPGSWTASGGCAIYSFSMTWEV